jgi:hypothetical protein
MVFAALMIFALGNVGAWAAPTSQSKQCLPQNSPQTIRMADAGGKTIENVLCCCPTSRGGQCCKYVSFCGSIIPGCFCH